MVFRYFLVRMRRYLPHIINGNILYMKTCNHALVVHILINIAIIAKCKYIEKEIAI